MRYELVAIGSSWGGLNALQRVLGRLPETFGAAGVVGVVLTGSNADGAAGLAAIRRRGGVAIVQDPEHAERPEMPRAAVAAVPDAQVLSLEEIAGKLTAIVGTTAGEAA